MNSYTAWLLYITICFYSIVDAYQTKMLLTMGAQEANPFLRWLIDIYGTPDSIWVPKLAVLVLLGVLTYLGSR